MGADYVIVNEVREPEEVKAWLNAVTTGHGGITTFHADDYQQMVKRLTVLAPGSEEVLKSVIAVIVGSELVPVSVGGNLKVMRRLRYVKDIIVPSEVNEKYLSIKDDLHLRRSIIGSLMDSSIDQLLSTIGKLYS